MHFLFQMLINDGHSFGLARYGCEFENDGVRGQAFDDGRPRDVVAFDVSIIVADYLA
jgi:hypothetical protein